MNYRNPSPKHRSRLSTSVRLGVAAVAACFIAGPVLSNPLNPTVVDGTATFNQVGSVLTVTNSNGAIINWNKFSIGAGETTHFAQASASSSVLNRVLNDPTVIYGTLSSNGQVWLVNPAGIMVGAGGRVDVAGFVASTLNISNADFLAGRHLFVNDGSAQNVINQGEIRTPAGGSVYLIGSNVTNEGIITTPQGETILAAGATVSLIDSATPGVKVDITGAEGNATNLGTITAEAGRIGIAGVIVRNSGLLNASSVVSEGGRIFLKASQDAYVDGNGRIVTTGTKGGSVEVLGNRVAVMDNAEIDASGTYGGGSILVGGDYQGNNPEIQNASITWFGPNATLKADATEVGDGGTVIVWADDTTRAYGSISARGGATGGNGGFVETSGKNYLAVDGIRVDTRAPQGTTGNWLLDPSDLTILNGAGTGGNYSVSYGGDIFTTTNDPATIYGATIETALSSTSVILQTDGGSGGAGNITATNVSISSSSANSLTLAAYGGVAGATGNIDITNSTFNVNGGITMLAGWDGGSFGSGNVIAGTGDINIDNSTIKSSTGAMNLWAGNNITLSATGYSSSTWIQGTTIDVRAGNNLTITGGYGVGASVLIGNQSNSGAPVTMVAGSSVTIDGGEGGVGIGSIGHAVVPGEVYIAKGSSISTTSAFSDITINAQKSVVIEGTVISAGTCGDCSDGVWITAGYSPTAFDNSFGGDIKLGPQSVITGYSVGLTGYSGGSAAGNIVQDPGGVIAITGSYSGSSNFFRADGNLLLDGAVVASGFDPVSGMEGYAGYSGAPGMTLRISNITSPNGGNFYFQSTGDAIIGSIYAPTGYVGIYADGAIYDNNGTALNITADTISLGSQLGGVAGGLAISMDTSVTSTLYGYVASGATFGGISIRNFGTSPSSIFLADQATFQSSANFTQNGDLTVSYGGTTISMMADDLALLSTGNMTIGSSGLTLTAAAYGSVLIGAAGNLLLDGADIFPADYVDVGLAAGGSITLTNGAYVHGENLLAVAGQEVSLAYGSEIGAWQTALVAAGSGIRLEDSHIHSDFLDVLMVTGGDIRVNNGSSIYSGNSVYLSMNGGASTLYLNEFSGLSPSYIHALNPNTINIDFAARSSGGIVIDGVPTTTTSGSSGFFVGSSMIPATAGAGLNITYANALVVDPCVSNPDLCKPPSPTSTPIDPPPVTLLPLDPTQPLEYPGYTIGGTEDSFGGEEEAEKKSDEAKDEKKDEKSAHKKVAQCSS